MQNFIITQNFFTCFFTRVQVHWCGNRLEKLFLKFFQSFIQLYLADCVSQICVLKRGISRFPSDFDLVWQSQLPPQRFRSAKELANFWFVSIYDIKRQFCRYGRSGNFNICNSLQYCLIESCCFLNKTFLKALYFVLVG